MYITHRVQVTLERSWLLELWSLVFRRDDNGYKWWVALGPVHISRKYRDG